MKSLVFLMLFLVGCATTARQRADTLAESHPSLIVMYEADWCPACQALKEPLKKIADQLEVVVIHINVDDYSENNNIGYYLPFIPILSVYKDGKLFYHGPAQDPNLIFFPFIKSEE